MKQQLTELLACPKCHHRPEAVCLEPCIDPPGGSSPSWNGDLVCGVLRCTCGAFYPVIEGVPRLLDRGINSFPEFASRFEAELKKLGYVKREQSAKINVGVENDYDNIRKSFSQEWGIFDYHDDKTWGWTLEDRKKIFLSDVAMKSGELAGKRVLDAGCGNGTLTAALSDFDIEIVGLDLNDGLGRAYQNRARYAAKAIAHVQYIQGNLVDPPLEHNSFDLIYSSGVIHHTPSSKKTFESLVRLTKPGGRLYVWVYGKRGVLVRLFFWWGRGLKDWMQLKSVLGVCRALAPLYKLAANTLHSLGLMKFRSRTTREITLDLFDAFAPRFNHWHTEAEVRLWFEEYGFRNVHLSGIQKHGFGMYGDKS